jgi:hypothetical protein
MTMHRNEEKRFFSVRRVLTRAILGTAALFLVRPWVSWADNVRTSLTRSSYLHVRTFKARRSWASLFCTFGSPQPQPQRQR